MSEFNHYIRQINDIAAEALAAFDKFRKNGFYSYRQRMNEVRKEFVAAVESHFTADPAAIDMATIELMKSGILTAGEYNRLMDRAISEDNHTMARLIGQHAKAAAENAGSTDEAANLRAIAYKSNGMNGSNYVEAFDFVTGLYDRCSRNPALYGKWDELAGEVIEKF